MTAFNAATSLGRNRRMATAVALMAGTVLTLTACSAGQVSQTADQVAAVNGNSADLGSISLRNVHVVYPQTEEYSLDPGGKVELGFLAINNNPGISDKLTRVATTEATSVTIVGEPGGREIEPQSALGAGAPSDTQLDDPAIPLQLIVVELNGISEDVRPGLTFPVTFTFEKAGDIAVQVPIDAGHLLPRAVSTQSPIEADAENAEQSVIETQDEEGAAGNN